jgi:hypothetical protein
VLLSEMRGRYALGPGMMLAWCVTPLLKPTGTLQCGVWTPKRRRGNKEELRCSAGLFLENVRPLRAGPMHDAGVVRHAPAQTHGSPPGWGLGTEPSLRELRERRRSPSTSYALGSDPMLVARSLLGYALESDPMLVALHEIPTSSYVGSRYLLPSR